MRNVFIVICLLVGYASTCQNISPTIDVANLIVTPQTYVVAKTNSPITIDGNINEAAWQNAPYTKNFIDIEGVLTPKYTTKVKMLWDDTYLYVAATLEEPHIWATLSKRDTIIFYNNDFEIFIDPSGTTKNYGEIEVNANNTVWDLHLDKPYRVSGKPNNNWDLKELQSAVKIYGTLNNPKDIDSMWTVEMAIPLKGIAELKGSSNTPIDGEQWRINFSRVEWDFSIINGKYYRKKINGAFAPEHNWVWSNQKVINMHEPEKWGYIQFTESTNPTDATFNKDEDLLIKQVAYALFRETKFNNVHNFMNEKPGTVKTYNVKYSNTGYATAIFTKTNFGFEIEINSNNTTNTYYINQEGVLKS